ncbi:hypothetical protein SEHO0A_01159 [Salmonella enterica subsp. houtenae str. ATCC BAA-1581]|nr:hypothetical protein SEHO0A_01159 [Salmonella enterica subsp. houtenae str. ATCC BAA-1581]
MGYVEYLSSFIASFVPIPAAQKYLATFSGGLELRAFWLPVVVN